MGAFIRKIIPRLTTDSFFIRLAATVLSIILFVVALAGLSLYQSKLQHEKQVIISTENLSQMLDQNIRHVMDKTNNVLLAMSDEINRQIVSGGINKQALNDFIAHQKERLQVADSLRMADEHGTVRYGTAVESAPKTNIADRDHFTRPRDNPAPQFFISKPVLTRIDKKWALPVSRRLNRPDGTFAGIVYANVELKTFIDMFSSLNVGKNGVIAMRDKEFKIIARYPEPGGLGSTIGNKAAAPQVLKMVQAGQKIGTTRAYAAVDNTERIFSFHEISPYPLYIVVGRATSEYLSDWRQEVIKTGSVVLLFVVVIFYFSWQVFLRWRGELQAREELYAINVELEKRVVERTDEIINANEQLETELAERKLAENQIKSLLAEKELLLREVHHRIKNNMATVTGMLSLQADTLQEPSAIAALNDAISRVRSMMILYDKLYRSADFRAISVKEYLPSLIDEIIGNFPKRGSITVEKQIDDVILEAKTLSSIGIILNELLTNAIKHAFIGREDGFIRISLSFKDNHATLMVQDDGIGIPESIDIVNSTGFGMQLVSILTEQLEGSIRIEREKGTRFVLEFEV